MSPCKVGFYLIQVLTKVNSRSVPKRRIMLDLIKAEFKTEYSN